MNRRAQNTELWGTPWDRGVGVEVTFKRLQEFVNSKWPNVI